MIPLPTEPPLTRLPAPPAPVDWLDESGYRRGQAVAVPVIDALGVVVDAPRSDTLRIRVTAGGPCAEIITAPWHLVCPAHRAPIGGAR